MSARGRTVVCRMTSLLFFLPLLFAAPLLLPGPALAAASSVEEEDAPPAPPPPGEWNGVDLRFRGTGRVAALDADGSLRLSDGRRLRLAGIALPRRPLPVPATEPWPIETEAETALAQLTNGQLLGLYQAGRSLDRYGRLPVQAVLEDGRWLQGVLLRQGLARVETTAAGEAPLQALRDAEGEARNSGLGLWRLAAYRIRAPAEAGDWVDSVQLVEGRVSAVRRGKDGLVLSFAGDRRHAFSVRLPFAVWTEWAGMPTLRQGMEPAAVLSRSGPDDPAALVGQRLRVRGWIGKERQAQIVVSQAAQLEWIAPARPWRRQRAGGDRMRNRDRGTRP